MPNCDWYGEIEDHSQILDELFSENLCEVYELSSDYSESLKKFSGTSEVLEQFNKRHKNGMAWKAVYLQLHLIGSGPTFKPRRVELNPKKCDGATFRYRAEGWGLIQLYLERSSEGTLSASHTNHNSKLRAHKWAPTCLEMEEPAAWDFDSITKFSSRLNRRIRKLSVGKIGSRAVLSGAFKKWNEGCVLSPYSPDDTDVEMK